MTAALLDGAETYVLAASKHTPEYRSQSLGGTRHTAHGKW
jgi:hypothetical protein